MADKEQEKLSPMLQQYVDIKKSYKDYILFFRLGDFYEMFFEDALLAARELELTLTARAGTPMCGVPHHSSEGYIKKLIDKGYKVAVCEQTTDPSQSKGLVEREVVRLVTAGTVIEASMLEDGKNNYIACIFAEKKAFGLAFSDVSTGEIHIIEKKEQKGKSLTNELISELSRYNPVEIIFNSTFLDFKEVHAYIKSRFIKSTGELLDDESFIENNDLLEQQFTNPNVLNTLSAGNQKKALCGLLNYFSAARKSTIRRFVKLHIHGDDEFMDVNVTAARNLELTQTMRSGEKKGSLLWVLDKTATAMGRRKLKSWIERPLISPSLILKRLDAVDTLVKKPVALFELGEILRGIYDLERLITRIVYKTANPRDIVSLGKAVAQLPLIKKQLAIVQSPLLSGLNDNISDLSEIAHLVENAINDEPPVTVKDGNVIKDGFSEELDRLRDLTKNAKAILEQLEENEKASTGIRNLKVGYNRVFGYYIEISKSQIDLAPAHYIRKQTLANGERYITDELKKIETEILSANDKIVALEEDIFGEIRAFIAEKLEEIQQTADAVATIDVLCSFAIVAIDNNYIKPEITLESVVDIKEGRHPVVEQVLTDKPFAPNDCLLDLNRNKLLIITGPNMSGKSTFMRQTALIVLMAQIGSFVPAKSARIGIADKLFTRVGASDDLATGQSTFMVEMNEVAEILNNATSKSLVILDEIGRGTSTFDGISIAKAVAEHISEKIGCRTLFATHYHELIAMEKESNVIRNFSVAVHKKGDEISFLHKIVEGGVDDSYGIEVAKLAGLPKKVIDRAKKELEILELASLNQLDHTIKASEKERFDFSALAKENAINKLKNLDTTTLTPENALLILNEIKSML